MKRFSNVLLVLGIVFILTSLFFVYQRHNPMRLAFADNSIVTTKPDTNKTLPSKIIIKRIDVDLPVESAEITENKWSDTKSGVSYLLSSPTPGSIGNSVLYGHNWPGLLGDLTRIVPGDIITIKFVDGSVRNFEVEFTTTVDPSQTGVLASSRKKQLTVYTCTGFLDSKRFVVTAFLKEDT